MPEAKTQDPPAGFSVCHLSDSPFVAKGLRAFFEYRDLGIKEATGGRFGAHVIRARPGTEALPQWHTHELQFQMVYVTRGWIALSTRAWEKCASRPGPASTSHPESATASWPTATTWSWSKSPCRPSSAPPL